MLSKLLKRNYMFVRGRISEQAFLEKGVTRTLQPGDAPPSAFTRVRKYPADFIPFNFGFTDYPLVLVIVSLVGLDFLLEEELKAATHRDDLQTRKFYQP